MSASPEAARYSFSPDQLRNLLRHHVVPFGIDHGKLLCREIMQMVREWRDQEQLSDTLATITSGPCLRCGVEIQYSGMSSSHKRFGDQYLRRLFDRPLTIEYRGSNDFSTGFEIRETKWNKAKHYTCAECERALVIWFKGMVLGQKAAFDKMEEKADRERIEGTQWLMEQHRIGDPRSVPVFIHCVDVNQLKRMRYASFLNSRYWKYCRLKVLRKADYRCSLCHSKRILNVHHKTYEHHGNEWNFDEDLIALCVECHSKFHDKLAAEPVANENPIPKA